MRKLFAIMLVFGANVFTVQAQNYREMDKIVLHDGKLILMHGNSISRPMLEDVRLEDGGRVNTDGTYVSPNGTTTKLKEGDIVYITGKRSTEKPAKSASKDVSGSQQK